MANSEDIEARLCAYIEGEVDNVEKAEIERHLQDHPRHRQMIEDLIRTRELVGGLPRVKAPADLSEGLYGQLERSALLGEGDDAHDSWRMHARRLPHVAAKAAVVALTIGLGLVVYLVLRGGSNPGHLDVEVSQAPATQPVLAGPTTLPAETAEAPVLGSIFQPDVTVLSMEERGNELDDFAEFFGPPTARPTTQPAADLTTNPPATQPTMEAIVPTTQPVAADDDAR
jgi:Putative zinc-finger